MIASVTIFDDNGVYQGTHELAPSRTYEDGAITRYVFEFEYNHLDYDRYRAEIESQERKEV